MKRKFFSLVPLLAVAAMAIVPAVSQAGPLHWYKGGVKLPANKTQLPYVSWGGKTNLKQLSPAGEINCKGAGAGYIENPEGGGAGKGAVLDASFYECKAPKCEAEVAASPLGGLGFKGQGAAVTYNFPWNLQLTETSLKTGAVPSLKLGKGFAEGYPAKIQEPDGTGTSFGAAGAIGAVVVCEIFPNPEAVAGKESRVGGELPFEGELNPIVGGSLNEGESMSKPMKEEFTGKATGELEDPLGPGAGGYNEGQVKFGGYELQAGLGVKE